MHIIDLMNAFFHELSVRTFPLREFYMPVRGDSSLVGSPSSVSGRTICFQV